jgi:amidase
MQQQQWELRLRDPSSPSSSNSIVGLKPTTGLLSVPVLYPCRTLDTPGPMTKNVIDSAILISVMTGEDSADPVTKIVLKTIKDIGKTTNCKSKGVSFGVNKTF